MSARHWKRGANNENIQEMNRSLILRLLFEMQICSRADLARASGLKQATITNIVNDLIEWGIIEECGLISGERGRRSIGLKLSGKHYLAIGVKLSRTRLSVGLFDILGNEYKVMERNIDASSIPEEVLHTMIAMIDEVMQYSTDASKILGIGLALPGPFISKEEKIILMTDFPGWEKISIRDELEAAFKMPIFTEHDGNAGALAEWWFGQKTKGQGTMIYVAAGQGIGAGVVIDGSLYTGTLGTAGEIGHMSIAFEGPTCQCGNTGCLELYCSTTAMLKDIRKSLSKYPNTMLTENADFETVRKAVRKNDPLAIEALQNAAYYLGFGLVGIINILNPDHIVIGDDMALLGSRFLHVVKETISEHTLSPLYNNTSVELTSFKRDAALIGAAALVTQQVLSVPSMMIKETGIE